METTIVLIGMLLPIAAATVFYAGDKQMKRAQQSGATSATPKIAGPADESSLADASSVGMAPAETALGNTTEVTTIGQPTAEHATAGQNVEEPRTAA